MQDIINKIDGQVQIIFERGEHPLSFRDAIWMSQAEYDSTPSETILAMQEERYTAWLSVVNPPQSVEE
jgi:hypothetical protein